MRGRYEGEHHGSASAQSGNRRQAQGIRFDNHRQCIRRPRSKGDRGTKRAVRRHAQPQDRERRVQGYRPPHRDRSPGYDSEQDHR